MMATEADPEIVSYEDEADEFDFDERESIPDLDDVLLSRNGDDVDVGFADLAMNGEYDEEVCPSNDLYTDIFMRLSLKLA